ncbi:hypothetical protein V496_09703 [Pseudogymnoascus sp. VKM F-4515 (FW-2607)]|nr:hypothetical protein V496_09703 [Pseudogymnoascus sp. VKM F-4515 (FW-2607)]
MSDRTRKEDMWAQSSTTTAPKKKTPTSPPESTPGTSPAKSNDGSSVGTNEGTNSTKASHTPTSFASTTRSGTHTPDADHDGLPQMPNVSRASEYAEGYEFQGPTMRDDGHREHADALTRALSLISLHGDTTPRVVKMAQAMAMN